jgi:hypothetical protein
MDLASVAFDWNTSDWKPKVDGTPPLFVVGGPKPGQNTCRYDYGYALHGRSFSGSRHLLGYLGGPFAEGSAIVAEKFEREGDQIRLIFRYDASPATLPKRYGNVCFFAASLDDLLPDGTYHLTVELKDLPADLNVPAIQRLEFQKPDPRIRQAQAYIELVKKRSPQELFDDYCAQAARMTGINAPHEGTFLGTTLLDRADEDSQRLETLKREIIGRGTAVSPLLVEALRTQAVRNPDLRPDQSIPPPGMARELMDMLTQIRDARAAAVMLDILSGRLRCNRFVVHAAVEHIEKLTLVRFRKFDPHHGSYEEAVCGPDATAEPFKAEDREPYERALAAKYARWIAGHPANHADASPWASEAVRMARAWLDADDLAEAYNAASFLRGGARQSRIIDEDPVHTTRRIAAILERCEVAGSEKTDQGFAYYAYRYKPTGQPLPVSIHNWAGLLTSGPPVPHEYAGLLIRLDREMPEYPGAMAGELLKVGGSAAMAYRVEAYKRLLADVKKAGIDPKTDLNRIQDRKHQPLVWDCQLFRWGIERWAGQTFAADADLDAWWSAKKGGTQQQWLEAGLTVTAARGDAGDRQSQYLLRLLLGDALPNPPDHPVWMEPGWGSDPPPRAEQGEPFRVKWLADHAGRLSCEVERGAFVLRPPGHL